MHRTKVPTMGSPGEAQRKYPQGVCRIRSAAKLLTAALLGSLGKGGVPQGDFLRAKGSERSFSPQRWKRSSRTFRRRGNVSFADKGVIVVSEPFSVYNHAPRRNFQKSQLTVWEMCWITIFYMV